jgi:uncharacterized protein DUF6454
MTRISRGQQTTRLHEIQPQKLHHYHPIFAALLMMLAILHRPQSGAAPLAFEEVKLPALRINGQQATAHTQGLEVVAGNYYVTARRDDVRPLRALLLRIAPSQANWDAWDITPVDYSGALTALDHPGGMQSDGERLWVPVAESKRRGQSVIRVFSVAGLNAGKRLIPDFEFSVDDHIGAIAVSAERKEVFGANWDTEDVYVWDLTGRPQRTLTGLDLQKRMLGIAAGSKSRSGVAVQDWKVVGDRLYASGLFKTPASVSAPPDSRLLILDRFLETDCQSRLIVLPLQRGIELAREAMAISDGFIHFLPEDLGASNRIFRLSLTNLLASGRPQ